MAGSLWNILNAIMQKPIEQRDDVNDPGHPITPMSTDTPMVMHILTDGPTLDRLTSAGAVRATDTGMDDGVGAVLDPAQMYIAACRAQHAADTPGVMQDGTWSGPVRDEYAAATGDVGTHEHPDQAFVALYVHGFIGPVVA